MAGLGNCDFMQMQKALTQAPDILPVRGIWDSQVPRGWQRAPPPPAATTPRSSGHGHTATLPLLVALSLMRPLSVPRAPRRGANWAPVYAVPPLPLPSPGDAFLCEGTAGRGMCPLSRKMSPSVLFLFFLQAGDRGLTAAMGGGGPVRAPGGPSLRTASVCPLPTSQASEGVPKPCFL